MKINACAALEVGGKPRAQGQPADVESWFTASYEVWIYTETHKVLPVLVVLESLSAEAFVHIPKLQLTVR